MAMKNVGINNDLLNFNDAEILIGEDGTLDLLHKG